MKLLVGLPVPMLLLAIGCAADPQSSKPLCDPFAPTAGRVAIEARVVRVEPGKVVLYDNGAHYLFVDARCNYWVNNPAQVWEETRSGVLDVEAAARLGESLRFHEWRDVSGTWTDSTGGVFDAGPMIFDDAKRAVVCDSLCDSPDVPATVKAMRDAFPLAAQELWDRGEAVTSGVRAIAVAAEPGPGMPFVDWPLARPISDFVRTNGVGFGDGTLEEDVASVRALKELRASFLRGDYGAFVWDALPVKSDGRFYRLYLRDTVPFEDARGVVPLTIDVEQ